MIGAIAASIVISSCSSTKITSTWKAADSNTGNYEKIVVLGIINDPDRTIRERMEGHLVGDLISHGYNAVSAYKVYGPKEFENITEDQARK